MAYSDFEKAYKFSIRDDTSLFFQNSGPSPEPSPFSLAEVTIRNAVEGKTGAEAEFIVYGAMFYNDDIFVDTGYMIPEEELTVNVILYNGIGHLSSTGLTTNITGNIEQFNDFFIITGPGTITVTDVELPK